jgi:hypothetical protein
MQWLILTRWVIPGTLIAFALAGTLAWDYRKVSHDMEDDSMAMGEMVTAIANPISKQPKVLAGKTDRASTENKGSPSNSGQGCPLCVVSPQSAASPAVQQSGQEETQQQAIQPLEEAQDRPPEIPGIFANLPQELASKVVNSERLTSIAQNFTEKVKAAGGDTASEAYKKAWKEAAQESDDQLRSTIGEEAFIKLKMEQARNGY